MEGVMVMGSGHVAFQSLSISVTFVKVLLSKNSGQVSFRRVPCSLGMSSESILFRFNK